VHVDASNWKKYSVGQTGDEVVRDGEFVRVPTVLMDNGAINDVRGGKKQLSLGYRAELDWQRGVTNGQEYDAVQTNIRANHLAIVDGARGGPMPCIGDSFTAFADHDNDDNQRSTPMTIYGFDPSLHRPGARLADGGDMTEVRERAAKAYSDHIEWLEGAHKSPAEAAAGTAARRTAPASLADAQAEAAKAYAERNEWLANAYKETRS
jgi:hypothetical protein